MEKILVLNSGSSSVKYQLLSMPSEERIASGLIEKIGEKDSEFHLEFKGEKIKLDCKFTNHKEALDFLVNQLSERKVVSNFDEIIACGHRVAHGGETFKKSTIITEETANEIEKLAQLAPLHNPANIQGYYILKNLLCNAIHVATFDTSFHQTISDDVYIYPIPYKYYEKYGLRKYGFHGTSHRFVSEELLKQLGPEQTKRIIVCHLGNGASLAAIKQGVSINTSMGVSPLGGILMGTRCGNVDPSLVEFICINEGKDVSVVLNELNTKSGLLGISGVSNDMRLIFQKAGEGHEKAKLALKIYARRVADYIGAYFVQLGGLDVLAFTAGVGENAVLIRKEIMELVQESLQIEFDYSKNENLENGKINYISKETSKVKVAVVPTNEEIIIARDTFEIVCQNTGIEC